MLDGFLDWHRAVVARKVEDLTLDDATRVMTPTGLSPLGVVAHLAAVEYGWFDETFLGNPVRRRRSRDPRRPERARHPVPRPREAAVDPGAHDRGNRAARRAPRSDARADRRPHGGL